MKTKNKFVLGLMILSIALLSSCAKDGDVGPAGKDGNANVTSVTLTASSWNWSTADYWRYNNWTGVSILTSEVCNTGAVMLYQTSGGVNIQLPITQTTSTGSTVEHDWYTYAVGGVSIYVENADFSDPISQLPIPTTYKLVCIPSKAMLAHPEVDLKNYEQVKAVFNLKD